MTDEKKPADALDMSRRPTKEEAARASAHPPTPAVAAEIKRIAPKKRPARKPAPKVAAVTIDAALIRRVLEGATLVFLPAFGEREPYTANPGKAHTITFGPFPEAALTARDEWSDFTAIRVAVDGIEREYPVKGTHDR